MTSSVFRHQQTTYARGATPRYTGDTPVKADSKKHTYTFAGWVDKADKSAQPTVYGSYELPEATADATYKATYDSADRIYTGTTWFSFKIVPRGTKFTKGTGLKKAVRLEWKKVSGVSGYYIQYANGFASIFNPNQTQCTFSDLAAGTTYTFNIHTFVTIAGQDYYSPWSKAIKVKTK